MTHRIHTSTDRAQSRKKLKKKIRDLETVASIGLKFASEKQVDPLLEIICFYSTVLLEANCARLWMFDHKGLLREKKVYGSHKVQNGLIYGGALGVLFSQSLSTQRYLLVPNRKGEGTAIIASIMGRELPRGFLIVETDEDVSIGGYEADILMKLVAQATLALENAFLIQALERNRAAHFKRESLEKNKAVANPKAEQNHSFYIERTFIFAIELSFGASEQADSKPKNIPATLREQFNDSFYRLITSQPVESIYSLDTMFIVTSAEDAEHILDFLKIFESMYLHLSEDSPERPATHSNDSWRLKAVVGIGSLALQFNTGAKERISLRPDGWVQKTMMRLEQYIGQQPQQQNTAVAYILEADPNPIEMAKLKHMSALRSLGNGTVLEFREKIKAKQSHKVRRYKDSG